MFRLFPWLFWTLWCCFVPGRMSDKGHRAGWTMPFLPVDAKRFLVCKLAGVLYVDYKKLYFPDVSNEYCVT